MFSASVMKKIGLFAGGVLFGTAVVKILSSKDAKKYIQDVRLLCCVQRTV